MVNAAPPLALLLPDSDGLRSSIGPESGAHSITDLGISRNYGLESLYMTVRRTEGLMLCGEMRRSAHHCFCRMVDVPALRLSLII